MSPEIHEIKGITFRIIQLNFLQPEDMKLIGTWILRDIQKTNYLLLLKAGRKVYWNKT